MSGLIVVDADALQRVAVQLQVPAERVRSALEAFNTAIAALGTPWGNDDLGQQWSKVYTPGVHDVQEGFDAIIDGLVGLSADFKAMAKAYVHVEYTNSR